MKVRFMQSGKALSAALFVLLLVAVGSKNALAQTQVAILQRGDSIVGAYYGEDAFHSACYASVEGDIITLSSGNFKVYTANYLKNSLTIRGAGCVYDSITNVYPTKITSTIGLSGINGITFEGIKFTEQVKINGGSSDNTFIKCCINSLIDTNGTSAARTNYQFINCIIKSMECILHKNSLFVNSVIKFSKYQQSDTWSLNNPIVIYNSVILIDSAQNIINTTGYNSIIATVSGHYISNCKFFNCLGIKTGETSLFESQENNTNMTVNNYSDVFETFDGTISFDNIYQLKEEIATSFLGNNGTEVGIYGGMMPYTTRLSYMKIKRCDVAPQSTVDGKLSVDIEVLSE